MQDSRLSFLSDLFSLDGEVAVVTGGTGILCGEIAQGLARAGAHVVVVGRDKQRGAQRVMNIVGAGGKAEFVHCDVFDDDSLHRLRDHITTQHDGRLTILVNGAGGNHPDATVRPELPFEDIPKDAWDMVLNLNLSRGVARPCQVLGPLLCEQQRCSVINIASAAAIVPLTRVMAYSAAKAGVVNLTKWLAKYWADKGVRVNSLNPGFFLTDQNRFLLTDRDTRDPSDRGQQIIDHTPLARFGMPSELVPAAIFLASHRASGFMTGADVPVSGGFNDFTI